MHTQLASSILATSFLNEKTWWYLARASGIVAMVLIVLSAVWGVLLATRVLKPHDRPKWLREVHTWFAGTAVVMVALHLAGLVLDSYINFGARELLVPGASSYRPIATSLGIVAFYMLMAVEGTSLMRSHLPRQIWHNIHLLSYPMLLAVIAHAITAGTDATTHAFGWLAAGLAVIGAIAVGVRALTERNRHAAA